MPARRQRTLVGVLSDTHDHIVNWDDIHPEVVKAFKGVHLVVHCGDLTSTAVLDRLATIAPVHAIRSEDDPPAEPPRLVDGPAYFTIEGFVVAATFELTDEVKATMLKRKPDVVLFGGTHKAEIYTRRGVLYVNPGSPSLAETRSVAVLDLTRKHPTAHAVVL
jgi:putative phosphoesterase